MNINREQAIADIKSLTQRLRDTVAGFSDQQLNTPYRDGGWTVRQVINHLVDSHTNGFIRLKMMLIEDHPTLIPYDQDKWAELPDTKKMNINTSLTILDGLQTRIAYLFENATEADYKRTAYHPEVGDVDFEHELENYSSHGNNHLGQITGLKEKMKW